MPPACVVKLSAVRSTTVISAYYLSCFGRIEDRNAQATSLLIATPTPQTTKQIEEMDSKDFVGSLMAQNLCKEAPLLLDEKRKTTRRSSNGRNKTMVTTTAMNYEQAKLELDDAKAELQAAQSRLNNATSRYNDAMQRFIQADLSRACRWNQMVSLLVIYSVYNASIYH